jgi:hypothetical protein
MAFAKPTDRFPTFLTGGTSWRTTIHPQTIPLTPKPILDKKPVLQTSFLGYRTYLKHKRSASQVSPTSQENAESLSSLSPQTQ